MKKLCLLLAALMLLAMAAPAFAEDYSAEMALLEGDWIHAESSEYYLLFDGVDKFYYEKDGDFSYGLYSYEGDYKYRLLDDEGNERILTINDDMSMSLEGIESYFECAYRYQLVDFPNMDEGTWLNEDGETELVFDLYGEFEFDSEDEFLYGEYVYQGGGDYVLTDDEGNEHILSIYVDGSIGMEGVDNYFWLQDEETGEDPFEYVKEDAELFDELLAGVYDNNPIELSGAWYRNGDPSQKPFILEGNTYSCEGSVFSEETETGTWKMDETIRSLTYDNTEPAACISMVTDDGIPSSWNPVLVAGNRVLYADALDVFFLHESMLGTEEGEQLCRMGEVMCADWCCEQDDFYQWLEFSCMDYALIFQYPDEEGASVQESVGTWELSGNSIICRFDDDTIVVFDPPVDSFSVAGMEFKKVG